MRNGRLILEDSPSELLRRFDSNLLEEVVLRFCLKDEATDTQKVLKVNQESTRSLALKKLTKAHSRLKAEDEEAIPDGTLETIHTGTWNSDRDYSTHSLQRLQAMFIKNMFVLFRSIG
jgi:hypothetical protein